MQSDEASGMNPHLERTPLKTWLVAAFWTGLIIAASFGLIVGGIYLLTGGAIVER